MTYTSLQLERTGHVAVVTLDRPERLNALNASLRQEVVDVAAELRADDDVRAVVITGAGRGFCSGVDLMGGPRRPGAPAAPAAPAAPSPPSARPQQSQSQRLDEFGWVGRQALALHRLDKPTIAAVNGVAAGAGMSLALACDLRVGHAETRFRTVFLERSLSPDSGMSWFLPRIIGYSRAADLILTSRDVGAEEAYRLGLLDRLFDDDLIGNAVALAEQMAALPPLASRSAKRVLQHNFEVGLEEALRYEMAGLDYARRAPNDVREAGLSFREKRPATFTGT